MNMEDTNAASDETFADDENVAETGKDRLAEKLKAVLEKAKQGEAAAIEQLRSEEEFRLDQAL